MSLAGVLALLLLASAQGETSVTRRHPVDTFSIKGPCGSGGCTAASMGTALGLSSDGCTCACAPHLPTFREDLHICVDDLHDCPLIPFVSGTTYQKIPFVFLPLKGQIVYPSAQLVFAGVESPVCVVSSAKYLSASGWEELRNGTDTEPPLRLFPDEGRMFLQWLGDGELRHNLEGRLILIQLMCKDMFDQQNPDNNIFTSCVSFRVAGSPSEVNPKTGVKEVTFSVDTQLHSENGFSSYIIIAVSSVLLGMIYIVSVLLYLHGKKKTGYKENNNGPLTVAEEGIVKNNPLLKHCHDNLAYLSEPPTPSDSEDGVELGSSSDEIRTHKVQTSALIHPCSNDKEKKKSENPYQLQDSSSYERLPEENISIVETLDYREDRPETVRTIACTNVRRKLYFNPAYFEPELLMAPPPAAIEFLIKIREVISIAKAKMEAKKFLPSLMGIPEENDYISHKVPSIAETESTVILRTDYYKHKYSRSEHQKHERNPDLGCHVCCRNSEQKQTSIQKWLENVPIARFEDEKNPSVCTNNKSKITNRKIKSHLIINNTNSDRKDEITQNNTLYENNERTCGNEISNLISNEVLITANIEKAIERISHTPNTNNSEKTKGNNESILTTAEHNKDYISSNLNKYHDTSYLNVKNSDNNFIIRNLKSNDLFKIGKEIKPISDSFSKNNSWQEEYNEENSTILCNNTDQRTLELDNNNKAKLMNKINNSIISGGVDIFDEKYHNNNNNIVYENKVDHDYETIMLSQKHEDANSLPDFINRRNGYSLVSEVYVNDGYDYISESSQSNLSSLNSNISDDEVECGKNSLGHLTIKVQDDPPVNYSNDSDSFEPDTLDRKPNKLKINQEISISIEKSQDIYADSLERPPHIALRSSGTFKKETTWNYLREQPGNDKHPLNRAFGSLREIFEAKTKYNQCSHNKSIKSCSPVGSTRSLNNDTETYNKSLRRGKPKLLRPEAKQARRQRDPSPPNHAIISPPSVPQCEEYTNNLNKKGGPPLPPRLVKPPLPPKNGTTRSNIHESDLKTDISSIQLHKMNNRSPRFMDIASESSEYEPLSSQEYSCYPLHSQVTELNSENKNKFFNDKNNKNLKEAKTHTQNRTEDSGYLSTDSNGSDTALKREDSISETDDSFFDGASESGAESIATDSFFFGKSGKSFKNSSGNNSPTEL